MTKQPYRPSWRPGDPCKTCRKPIATLEDKYRPDEAVCKPCGNAKRQRMRDAARAKWIDQVRAKYEAGVSS